MAESCCGKPVDVAALQTRQRRVLTVVLVINALTFLMMAIAALQARSSSLLSGGNWGGSRVAVSVTFCV